MFLLGTMKVETVKERRGFIIYVAVGAQQLLRVNGEMVIGNKWSFTEMEFI